jgi:ATP-dependent DNA helicase RecG
LFNAGTPDLPPALEIPLGEGLLLNGRQERALQFLTQGDQKRITNGDLQALFPDVHPETIRRDLADLVGKGLLVKLGQKRGSYYVLQK